MTVSELRTKLAMKTDNQEWIEDTLTRLKELGYLKSDDVFAEQFVEQSFFAEYGSSYIVEKLKKKGLPPALVAEVIERIRGEKNIDEQAILIERVNREYQTFSVSKEKLVTTLQKRGFSYAQVIEAIQQHAAYAELKTNLEMKAEKADLEKELYKYVRKGKGLTVIRQELNRRKIDTTKLDALVEQASFSGEIDFYASCLQQLHKKSYDLSDFKERGKAYAMLSRKGFSSEEIKYALNEAASDSE